MTNKNEKRNRWNLPAPKSRFSDKSPTPIAQTDIHFRPRASSLGLGESPLDTVGPDTQELQNIRKMILSLQLDLQEERCKRECLEEKVNKFGLNPTRKSQKSQKSKKTPERNWELNDKGVPNEEIPQIMSFLPAENTVLGVDEEIGDLRSDFELRMRKLEHSLLEIRSILANNPVACLKSDEEILLKAGPSKDNDYNRFMYKKLERGIFPRQISLEKVISKSVGELLTKPRTEKTEIEAIMDQYYLDNLPPAFLRLYDIADEDPTPGTKGDVNSISNRDIGKEDV
jgi:hypothetical protein